MRTYTRPAIFCYLVCALAISGAIPALAETSDLRQVTDAGTAGFQAFLAKIPVGSESDYGFANRDEIARVTLGQPIQTLTVVPDSLANDLIPDKEYLVPTNEWRVPLSVDEQMRALLTVAKVDGVWRVVGLGAAGLAKELQAFEVSHEIDPARQGRALLRIFQAHCDFLIITDSGAPAAIYPLQSAVMALKTANRTIQNVYTENELLPVVKANLAAPALFEK